ncbi:PleD family two-component system response regulator [Rhizobium sp. RM]|uniref:GGDEF domain-containing response regulator n=1 Tax=Rhizobium sp. RM TaxID=2748079 RepID=UPI00110E1DF3|nr:PleD family two-component system response regulator [Rhizobium sp. RM]NWJ22718.1 PleD family two-component system response regulator [Rhizobium sp. RM]TMV12374.1 PleD family two-component system response regulator [Rhizobium sp. Td3]
MLDKILLIEDSVALSMLLKKRLAEETQADVVHCDSMKQAKSLLVANEFTLALTGLNLPDAPKGEILGLLADHKVPTIVFTATVDEEARRRYAEKKIIDYIVKDGHRTVDAVVKTVDRILTNRQFSVLIVDDARSARSGLVEILERQNFRVSEAHSGKQALEILAREPSIQLVLTDYHMPDMDGYELTRRIRDSRSSEDLRIIGISSSSDRLLSASFLKAGASDFIYRPFVPEELQCRIDNNIETMKQLKRLRELAERDHLTGLPNRRSFFDRTRALMDIINRDDENGAVAILDIDHFKKINDTLGHDAGDRALKKLADLLNDMCQGERHIPARLGGEEFAIFLRGLDADSAYQFCERLRAHVEANGQKLSGSELALTISLGVVGIEKGEPFDNQLNAADQLLYLAKANGRNRVYSDVMIEERLQKMGRSN